MTSSDIASSRPSMNRTSSSTAVFTVKQAKARAAVASTGSRREADCWIREGAQRSFF
jgi:hypothetical protein